MGDQGDYEHKCKREVKIHEVTMHEGFRYFCDECPFQAKRRTHLRKHTATKHDETRYFRDQCEFSAINQSSLFSVISGHFLVQKDDLPKMDTTVKDIFQCKECEKWFDLPHGLERHKQSHLLKDKYSCTKCEKMFSSAEYIGKHKKTHHALKDIL